MGDDHSFRAYRSSETIARTGQARSAAPVNDPLAELARLIGQNDPFGEAAQASARLAEAGNSPPAGEWPAPSQAPSQSFAAADFSVAQSHVAHAASPGQYGDPQHSHGAYESEQGIPAYLTSRAAADHPSYTGESPAFALGEQGVYDDGAHPRRRIGVVFAIFALAVAGSAGAFGYHAMFGPAGSAAPPPVIKADTSPSKIVPEKPKDAAKLINERVGDSGAGEKVVAREEKPVDITAQISPAALPAAPQLQQQASAGNGVIVTEPRKVHTILIRPDGEQRPAPMMASAAPQQAPAATAQQPTATPPVAVSDPAPRPAAPPLAPARPAAHPQSAHVAHSTPTEPRASAAVRNAPLSLNPDAPATPRTRVANAAPAALAAAPAAAAPAIKKGGYAVQVSSRRSEEEAKADFHRLQEKYSKQLGHHSMFVHKVDLGAKGVYYRAMVGPFASSSEASALCSSLKSAGGSCLIQRN